MSCNGCRVLRKGCSDTCILRPCLQWIESPEAQGHATVFVAKFFGRAGLMGFISAVPENQRPALFQSLLYEACGRTVNPVYGAVGLLWTGNWHVCQTAVETVLKGGALRPAASLPAVSKPMQSLPGIPLSSTMQKSKLTVAPETPAVSRPSPERSLSSARCTEALRPKRALVDESHSGAAERGITYTLQERPQVKRYRNAEQEALKEVRSDCVDGHHQQQQQQQQLPCLSNQPPSPWASKLEASAKREQPQSAGQLVAPVPRRVRPPQMNEEETEISGCFRFGRAHQVSREEMLAESSDNIELGLALNPHPSASSGRMKLGFARVSSPSTISVNSEGSVTSLDSAELSISRWPARSPSPREEHKLLDLLS